MPLWTPKDSSRPLWTQGRRPPNYTGRRIFPPSFALDYHRNSEGRGRGDHQSAKSLEEAYHLVTAAAGESGWNLPQRGADAGTRLRSDRVRHPHAE